jgi:hypothetical protein
MEKNNSGKISHPINLRKLIKPGTLVISTILILSMLSVFATSVQAATTTTFGNTVIGTYWDANDANAQSISYFTATTTGTITNIKAYIAGASTGNAIAALYAVNGNTAGALIAQTKSVNIGTTFSWVDFQLPTPYTVTAGTTYGLAIMGNIPVNIMLVSGTGQRAHNAVSTYINGFANPFGTIWGTDNTGAMSIYATGTTTTTTPPPAPPPAPIPTPTQTPNPSVKRELYLWIGFGLTANTGSAKIIADTADSNPNLQIWIDSGNWNYAQWDNSLIDYFHAHNVKIVVRLWSHGLGSNLVSLDTIEHGALLDTFGGSIDFQMKIGNHIDAFMIDEMDPWSQAYYQSLVAYVHSLGKLCFVNPGGQSYDISTTLSYADKVSLERYWYIQTVDKPSWFTSNPTKFIACSDDRMYSAYDASVLPPQSVSSNRPAYSAPMSESRAVWETKYAWANGVSCFEAMSGGDTGEGQVLDRWFTQYASTISSG